MWKMNSTVKYILTLLLSLAPAFCLAQNGMDVSGRVLDVNGEPLTGAVVMVKGSSNGTMVAEDGRYALSGIPEDAVLVAGCLGYSDSELPVEGRCELDFVLREESTLLDDVIVVAYGTAKKESFTGSASVVKGDDLSKRPVGNLTKSFAGPAAGGQATSGGRQGGCGRARGCLRRCSVRGERC